MKKTYRIYGPKNKFLKIGYELWNFTWPDEPWLVSRHTTSVGAYCMMVAANEDAPDPLANVEYHDFSFGKEGNVETQD